MSNRRLLEELVERLEYDLEVSVERMEARTLERLEQLLREHRRRCVYPRAIAVTFSPAQRRHFD